MTLTLSDDEALVLSELIFRFQQTNQLTIEHAAEFLVLSKLAGLLDQALVAPFDADYDRLLGAARDRIAEGFEGPTPGMAT